MAIHSNYTGPTTSVVIVEESTWGTDPGTGYTALGVYDADVSATLNPSVERVYALGSRVAQATVGKQVEVNGTISGDFQDATLLAYALGADAVTGTGPYTHWLNFKTAAALPVEVSPLPSFTMVVTRGTDNSSYDTVETYTGCRINQLTLSSSLDAPMKVSADFIAKNVSVDTSGNQAAAFSTDEVHPPQYQTMSVPASTALGQVQSWELTLNNSLERVYALGSQLPQALIQKQLEIDLRGTVAFTDEAIWALKEITGVTSAAYTFGDTGAPKVDETVKLKSSNGGSTTAERTLQLNLTNVAFSNWSASARVNEVTMLDFDAVVRDFDQSNWGAVPTGAPITFINNTDGAYL